MYSQFLNLFFHTHYILIIFSTPPVPPSSSPLSFMFLLPLNPPKKQKSKVNKQPKKPIGQSNIKQKVHKKTCVSQLLLGTGPSLKSSWDTQWHSIRENTWLWQRVSITESFLCGSGTLCPLPLLSSGILSGLNLCRSWACCHNCCGFPCASALLCLGNTATISSTYDLSASSLA